MAFEEARHSLDRQATKVDQLTNRAVTVASVSAALTAFLARGGHGAGDRILLIALMALMVGVAVLSGLVVYPRQWTFTNHADDLIHKARYLTARQKPAELRKQLWTFAYYMEQHYDKNKTQLDRLYDFFQIALGLLILQALVGAARLL